MTARTLQNADVAHCGKYNPEAFRQFTLRAWAHKMECNEVGISCGCRTLSNVNSMDEGKFVQWINGQYESAGDKPFPQRGYVYLFSDTRSGIGPKMADWIKKYKLGTCVTTNWAKNPNSGCQIRVWLWRYNGKKVQTNATT